MVAYNHRQNPSGGFLLSPSRSRTFVCERDVLPNCEQFVTFLAQLFEQNVNCFIPGIMNNL